MPTASQYPPWGAPPVAVYTVAGPGTWTGLQFEYLTGSGWLPSGFYTISPNTVTCLASPPPPLAPSPGLAVPNEGMIQIGASQQQAAYDAPGGEVAEDSAGNPIGLPADAEGSGFDTYVVTDIQVAGGNVWLGIFMGSSTWGWVPYDGVTPMTNLDVPDVSGQAMCDSLHELVQLATDPVVISFLQGQLADQGC